MENIEENKINEQIEEWNNLYKEQDDFYHNAAKKSGLSDAAYWILYRIGSTENNVSQSELCKEWFFSKQTINSAVVKLIKEGYVELSPVNGCGNRKILVLTEDGKAFCEKYVNPILNAERNSFKALTEEERNMMLYLMKKQLNALKQGMEDIWQ